MLGAAPAPTTSVCSASTKYSAGEHKIYSPLIGVSVLNTLFYNAAQQSCTFLFWKKKPSMKSTAFSLNRDEQSVIALTAEI